MDWLVSGQHPDVAGRAAALVGDHLRRHAADPGTVAQALRETEQLVSSALTPATAALRLRLDWTGALPTLAVGRLADAPAGTTDGAVVPVRERPAVDARVEGGVGPVDLAVERRVQEIFRAGPPPTPLVDVDPRRDGAAAVAVALVAAREAHPTVSGPQSSGLAGAILAQAAMDRETDLDAHEAAALIQELHAALGSDAQVEVSEDGVLEMSMTTCPFGPGVVNAPSLCHVTAGLAGQIAARVQGHATVLIDETRSLGDPGCHLHVRLEPAQEDVRGETHQWPTVATTRNEPTPHLDLSLSLPNESGSVPVVRRLAAQALRAFGVLGEDIDDVQLAITEACANVVDHANDADTYEVKVELAADRCAITVVDQGRGFDASAVAGPPALDSESGRGLMLMRALVDNVAFQSEPRAGALVHMVKTLRFDHEHPLWRDRDLPHTGT
ncbi:ATP-binding protein [Nocardioides panacis]|uniref:ATP-binding protein n=1 Tax=Nocardioides panacis TaxID=2849501 RepID=A0A975T2T3_9ACTN|nr:ATP-binding protein [Nocardioides panacis]QWZ09828.1 ATP-binding protein [Nocardioides panacis]